MHFAIVADVEFNSFSILRFAISNLRQFDKKAHIFRTSAILDNGVEWFPPFSSDTNSFPPTAGNILDLEKERYHRNLKKLF